MVTVSLKVVVKLMLRSSDGVLSEFETSAVEERETESVALRDKVSSVV